MDLNPDLLFRPFTGRLHCGGLPVVEAQACGTPVPAIHWPAPLRRPPGRPADRPQRLFRPFTGRLHCGHHSPRGWSVREWAVPAIHWPAPLRRAGARPVGGADRLFRPFTGRLHCGNTTTAKTATHSPAVPAIHWPAPLRRAPGSLEDQHPVPVPAIHWPAPLRRGGAEREDPVITGCSGHSLAGSIAASPLSEDPAAAEELFRPFTGRLHCGSSLQSGGRTMGLLFRPFTGRLHCGLKAQPGRYGYPAAVPAIHWPAPLRHGPLRGARPGCGTCSGHSLAGSIAARGSRATTSSGSTCSGHSLAGSIAAATCGCGRTRRSACSGHSLAGSIAAAAGPGGLCVTRSLFRPFTGRLHCGDGEKIPIASFRPLFRPFTGRLHCGHFVNGV